MTDRELLELAAKAAGIKILQQGGAGYWQIEVHERGLKGWNPLIDDGDALRLAVKFGICVTIDRTLGAETEAWGYGEIINGVSEDHNDDPYAATRRAIVRAAAEIGKYAHSPA